MSAIREGVTAHPLYWPEGWKRTPAGKRKRSSFGKSVYRQCGYQRSHTVYPGIQGVLGGR